MVGLASGLRAWVGGRRGRERSFPGNGMRLEGGFPGWKWERRKSACGNVAGKRMGEQELQAGQEGEGGA